MIGKKTESYAYAPYLLYSNEKVRGAYVNSMVEGIKLFGRKHVVALFTRLEERLNECTDDASHDALRHAIIVFLGTLARHMLDQPERIEAIVKNLVASLSTPSQIVQEAAANCLPPLVRPLGVVRSFTLIRFTLPFPFRVPRRWPVN